MFVVALVAGLLTTVGLLNSPIAAADPNEINEAAKRSSRSFKEHYTRMRQLLQKMSQEGPGSTRSELEQRVARLEAARAMLERDQAAERTIFENLEKMRDENFTSSTPEAATKRDEINAAFDVSRKNLNEIRATIAVADEELRRAKNHVKLFKPDNVDDQHFRLQQEHY